MKSSQVVPARGKPAPPDRPTRSADDLQAGGGQFKPKTGWSRQTGPGSTRLPPISRPKGVSGKAGPPLQRKEPTRPRGHPTHLPTAHPRRENTLFQVRVAQSGRGNQEAWNQISVVGGNKWAGGLNQRTPGARVDASLLPARADPQRKDAAPAPAGVKHDPGLARLPSDDSAIESESSGSGGGARPTWAAAGDKDGDYYTHERIAEWVQGVNASVFTTTTTATTRTAVEHDVATIKIVYGGD